MGKPTVLFIPGLGFLAREERALVYRILAKYSGEHAAESGFTAELNAIILQAVKDYRTARRAFKKPSA